MLAVLGVAAIGGRPVAAISPADAMCFSSLQPDMPRAAAGRRASHAPAWQGRDREASEEPSSNWGKDDDEDWTRQKRRVRTLYVYLYLNAAAYA